MMMVFMMVIMVIIMIIDATYRFIVDVPGEEGRRAGPLHTARQVGRLAHLHVLS